MASYKNFLISIIATFFLSLATLLGVGTQLIYITAGLVTTCIAAIADLLLTALSSIASMIGRIFVPELTTAIILANVRGIEPLRYRVLPLMMNKLQQTLATICAARPEMQLTEWIFFKIFFAPSLVFLVPAPPREVQREVAPVIDALQPILQDPALRANNLIIQVDQLRRPGLRNYFVEERVLRAYEHILQVARSQQIAEHELMNVMSEGQFDNYFFTQYRVIFMIENNLTALDLNFLSTPQKYFYYARAAQEIFEHSAEWLSSVMGNFMTLNNTELERNEFELLEIHNVIILQCIARYLNALEAPEHYEEKTLALHQMRLSFINFLEKLKTFRLNAPENAPIEAGLIVQSENNRVFAKLKIYALIYNQLARNDALRNLLYHTALNLNVNMENPIVSSETPIRNVLTVCFSNACPLEYFAAIKSTLALKSQYSSDVYYLRGSLKKKIETLMVEAIFASFGLAAWQLLSGSQKISAKMFMFKTLLAVLTCTRIQAIYQQGDNHPRLLTNIPRWVTENLMPFTKDLRNPNICYEASLWKLSLVLALTYTKSFVGNSSNSYMFMINLATIYHIAYFLSKINPPALEKDIKVDVNDLQHLIPVQLNFGVYGCILKQIITNHRTTLSRPQLVDGFSNTLLLLLAHFAIERYRSSDSVIAAFNMAFNMIFIWGPIWQLMSQAERYIEATREARATLHSIQPLAEPETRPAFELEPALPIVSFVINASRQPLQPAIRARLR